MSFKQFLIKQIGNLVYPKYCVACYKLGNYLCHDCANQINFYHQQIKLEVKNNYLDEVYAMAKYQFPMDKLIQTMKYKSVRGIAGFLGKMLWQNCYFPKTDKLQICAVPIHKKRLQERGFNQAEEIAKNFALAAKLHYQPWLTKIKNTKHQAKTKTKQERLSQLADSFAINSKVAKMITPPIVTPPEQILIIDDVLTTGATLNECARILKNHGIAKVIGLTIVYRC